MRETVYNAHRPTSDRHCWAGVFSDHAACTPAARRRRQRTINGAIPCVTSAAGNTCGTVHVAAHNYQRTGGHRHRRTTAVCHSTMATHRTMATAVTCTRGFQFVRQALAASAARALRPRGLLHTATDACASVPRVTAAQQMMRQWVATGWRNVVPRTMQASCVSTTRPRSLQHSAVARRGKQRHNTCTTELAEFEAWDGQIQRQHVAVAASRSGGKPPPPPAPAHTHGDKQTDRPAHTYT